MKTIHFTIGPVQGFVAQSRRTRDLLASSFMLSYLSGHAMMRIIQNGGRIVFPYVQEDSGELRDPLLQAIERSFHEDPSKTGPWIGSLPNRFKAQVPEAFDPDQCVEAVMIAWQRIADAVWEKIAGAQVVGEETKKIWDRQVGHFWDIAWVVGEENDLLDRRKNWQSFVPTIESGGKCTLLSHLQELSSHYRLSEQREFWQGMKQHLRSYDLGENERLSAIGMIKRLFTRVSKQAIGWELPKEAHSFPSTTYLAALPWVSEAIKLQKEEAIQFADAAIASQVAGNEKRDFYFPMLQEDVHWNSPVYSFIHMTEEAYYRFGLEKILREREVSSQQRNQVLDTYERLTKKIGEPNTYYALLLMDGDRLGNLLQNGGENSGQDVSQALSQFTAGLEKLVREHNGATVYAGGDDVLAMLPMCEALSVARKLRIKYRKAFSSYPKLYKEATISAAIIYAHHETPLQSVLQTAHQLLDDVAKDQTGRDSLAIGVYQRSGIDLVWSAPWDVVYRDTEDETGLEQIARKWMTEQDAFSNSFLYKLHEKYDNTLLSEKNRQEYKEMLTDLIVADYRRIHPHVPLEEAKNRVSELLRFCFRSWREDGTLYEAEGTFQSAGALLLRFIVQKGGIRR